MNKKDVNNKELLKEMLSYFDDDDIYTKENKADVIKVFKKHRNINSDNFVKIIVNECLQGNMGCIYLIAKIMKYID